MAHSDSRKLERLTYAFHRRDTGAPEQRSFQGIATARHERQLEHAHHAERGFGAKKRPFCIPFADAFQIDSHHNLCLFNVIVALEWVPGAATLDGLRDAFDQAADLLFDVTDGLMTFGQVLVGGPELMECADIQIFASTRLFPRSSVGGLLEARKYQPIRLGRGLWSKQHERIVAWNEEPGPATLAHEWSHYALGLKDQYLEYDRSNGIVFPRNSLVENTLMASLEKSELLATPSRVDHPGCDDSEWSFLRHNPYYQALTIVDGQHPVEASPALVPTPAFRVSDTILGAAQEATLALPDAEDVSMSGGRCWAYVLKGGNAPDTLRGVVAQGSLGGEDGMLDVYGVEVGDGVVLSGRDHNGAALVLEGRVSRAHEGNTAVQHWERRTPAVIPTLSVTATSHSATPPYSVRVEGGGGTTAIIPLGQHRDAGNGSLVVPGEQADNLRVLDGHILYRDQAGAIALASYSVGGSPSSGYPAHPNPIPAGSSDGNAMLFFYEEAQECLDAATFFRESPRTTDAERVRVVVTTSTLSGIDAPQGLQPRSYTFGVTSNVSFRTLNGGDPAAITPTLVLYYDQAALDEDHGTLVLCRLNAGRWTPVEHGARQLEDKWFVAAPIDQRNAPNLYAETPSPECYRLFLSVQA